MIRKLQIKFIMINMVMITAMLCVIFGLVYNFTRHNLERESISMMRSIATVPFRPTPPDRDSNDFKLPFFSIMINQKGELVSTHGGYYDLSDQALLQDLIAATTQESKDTGILPEYTLRFYRANTPRGTAIVFSDMSSETTTLNNLIRSSVLIGLFSFLVFLCISIFLSRWAVRPMSEAWTQQKQFVADASHELKTPLTVIMTNAELLQSDTYTQAEREGFSKGILLMSHQMRQLVENMLELARTDANQNKLHMQPVDLSRLILDTSISFEGVFVEKGLAVESDVEPGITVQGDEQALQQVVDILLDNAQKYSDPGGTTYVQLRSNQGKCQIKVSNPGPELSPEERKKIFRRFYRMDKARSRSGSFGLGLSIAESIVSQHRGKIWAESKDGINTFIVELRKGT